MVPRYDEESIVRSFTCSESTMKGGLLAGRVSTGIAGFNTLGSSGKL